MDRGEHVRQVMMMNHTGYRTLGGQNITDISTVQVYKAHSLVGVSDLECDADLNNLFMEYLSIMSHIPSHLQRIRKMTELYQDEKFKPLAETCCQELLESSLLECSYSKTPRKYSSVYAVMKNEDSILSTMSTILYIKEPNVRTHHLGV